jgi:hypothetical protein
MNALMKMDFSNAKRLSGFKSVEGNERSGQRASTATILLAVRLRLISSRAGSGSS